MILTLILFSIIALIFLAAGATLTRYGIGLGARMIYETKENLPVLNSDGGLVDTDQVNTDGLTDEDLE